MTDLEPIARYTEVQAAQLIGCSHITLKRERHRGNIEYTLIGVRSIKYTQQQIDAYLQKRRRCNGEKVEPCAKGHLEAAPASPRSETSGCRGTQAPMPGTSPGMTRSAGKLVALAQASQILRSRT